MICNALRKREDERPPIAHNKSKYRVAAEPKAPVGFSAPRLVAVALHKSVPAAGCDESRRDLCIPRSFS